MGVTINHMKGMLRTCFREVAVVLSGYLLATWRTPSRLHWVRFVGCVVIAGLGCGRAGAVPAPAMAARSVVVIVANRLMPDDLRRYAPRSMRDLLARASLGVLSSRGASFEGDAGGFGGIGAGAGVVAPPESLPTRMSDLPAYAAAMAVATQASHSPGVPGSLGQAIEDNGGYTALVGSAPDEDGSELAAALIVMDRTGRVGIDRSMEGDTSRQQSWSYRRRSSPDRLGWILSTIRRDHPGAPGLIVVDFADTSRVDRWTWLDHPSASQAEIARGHWMPEVLRQLDRLLEPAYADASLRGDLLCLVSPVPCRRADGSPLPGLTPLALWGPGFSPGPIISASTRRAGLSLALDLAPTLLQFLGIRRPPSMTGQPVHSVIPPGEGKGSGRPMTERRVNDILTFDAQARSDYHFETWALIVYGSVAGLSVFLALILPASSLRGARSRLGQYCILIACSGPAALMVPMAVAGGPVKDALIAVACGMLFPLVAFRWRSSAARLGIACSISAAALLLDGISCGGVFRDALWGRMPIAGGRLYGIDNTCMGVLIGAAWLALGICSDRWPRRGRRAACVGVVLTAVVVGLPQLGANVGGGITACIGAGFFVTSSLARDRRWGMALSIILASGLVLVSLVLDAASSMGSHLIGSWNLVRSTGWEAASDLAIRKLWQNVALTRWLLIPGIPIYAVLIVKIRQGSRSYHEWFASMPGLSFALRSLIPTMAAGYLLNDTGAITDLFLSLYYFAAFAYFRLDACGSADCLPAQAGDPTPRRE